MILKVKSASICRQKKSKSVYFQICLSLRTRRFEQRFSKTAKCNKNDGGYLPKLVQTYEAIPAWSWKKKILKKEKKKQKI